MRKVLRLRPRFTDGPHQGWGDCDPRTDTMIQSVCECV